MTTGTQKEYSIHLDCSESYVSRLKRQGKLVFDGDLVDFEKSDALVAAARDPDREGQRDHQRQAKGGLSTGDRAAAGADDEPDAGEETGAAPKAAGANKELFDQRLRAQVRAAEHTADINELDLHERAGSVMSVGVFRDRVYAYGRHVRDTWQSLEARMSPHLDSEQLRILRQEIQTIQHELDRRVAAESRVKPEAGATEPA